MPWTWSPLRGGTIEISIQQQRWNIHGITFIVNSCAHCELSNSISQSWSSQFGDGNFSPFCLECILDPEAASFAVRAWLFDSKSVFQIGKTLLQTIVKASDDPIWSEEGPSCFFMFLHSESQDFNVSAYCQRAFSQAKRLASAKIRSVSEGLCKPYWQKFKEQKDMILLYFVVNHQRTLKL